MEVDCDAESRNENLGLGLSPAPAPAAGTGCTNNKQNAFALVPYDDSKVSNLHRQDRSFQFGSHIIVIEQQWQTVGVAAVVWDAAVVLGKYLHEHSSLVKDKRLLELGAGTGLAGLLCAMLGADVVLTDRQMALATLNANMARNSASGRLSVRSAELEWGHPSSVSGEHFDVVIGADIIYIEETFSALLQTLDDVTSADTILLLACKIRYDRDRHFLQLLQHRFTLKTVLYDAACDIYIYEATRLDIKQS